MSLAELVNHATDKKRFQSIENYIDFCAHYLEYIDTGLQARIVSQNESHYQFFQYREEGSFNITRPLNSSLPYSSESFDMEAKKFMMTLSQLRDGQLPSNDLRENLIRTIYTLQQSIGIEYLVCKQLIYAFLYHRLLLVHNAIKLHAKWMMRLRWLLLFTIVVGIPVVFYTIVFLYLRGGVTCGMCAFYAINNFCYI